MPDIVASLKDYSMLKVQCERGIAQELSEYFSFFVPGYKFMPAFKAKVWDGKIRLFNTMNGELSAGLYVYMIKFCAERGYEMDTEETDYGLPALLDKVDPEFLKEFYKQLKLPYELREYQHDAVTVGLQRRNAILLSPTGSGKSLIIYCLMRHILGTEKNKILIIVPTTSLVEQLHKDFTDYGYDADNKVHKIYSGKEKVTNKRIIISTWQSIYKFPKKWFEQFSAVFGDECHGFKSKSLSSIMNKATEAKYRFGTTGTLDGTLTHKLVLEGLFGPVYQVTATKKLQDDGTLAH
jgi:superfamily II DNA or RNA helicase